MLWRPAVSGWSLVLSPDRWMLEDNRPCVGLCAKPRHPVPSAPSVPTVCCLSFSYKEPRLARIFCHTTFGLSSNCFFFHGSPPLLVSSSWTDRPTDPALSGPFQPGLRRSFTYATDFPPVAPTPQPRRVRLNVVDVFEL